MWHKGLEWCSWMQMESQKLVAALPWLLMENVAEELGKKLELSSLLGMVDWVGPKKTLMLEVAA